MPRCFRAGINKKTGLSFSSLFFYSLLRLTYLSEVVLPLAVVFLAVLGFGGTLLLIGAVVFLALLAFTLVLSCSAAIFSAFASAAFFWAFWLSSITLAFLGSTFFTPWVASVSVANLSVAFFLSLAAWLALVVFTVEGLAGFTCFEAGSVVFLVVWLMALFSPFVAGTCS